MPCNFHRFRFDDLSIHSHIALHDRKIASMTFPWLVHFFDIVVMLDHGTSWYTARGTHIESYFVLGIE